MRTAKNFFNGYKRLIDSDVSAYWCTEKDFIKAINEARIEAIKECAEINSTLIDGKFTAQKTLILSLIEHVK